MTIMIISLRLDSNTDLLVAYHIVKFNAMQDYVYYVVLSKIRFIIFCVILNFIMDSGPYTRHTRQK